VVFALQWQKDYPWSFGERPKKATRGGGWQDDRYTPWIRAVDDIEKVQWIEIRHERYRVRKMKFGFDHLLQFGQDEKTEWQEPRLFRQFEEAWTKEMKRKNVKFCVLDLGTEFDDFQNKQSTRPEFFEKIRDNDFGTVYTEPHNFFSVGEHPQSECGPYFVYLMEVELEPRPRQIDVYIHEPEPAPEEEPGEAKKEHFNEEARHGEVSTTPDDRDEEEQIQPKEEADKAAEAQEEEETTAPDTDKLGLAVETLTSSERKRLGLPIGVKGALITYVEAGSPADGAGLRKGQVIYAIDHRSIKDVADYKDKIEGKDEGDQFSISVWRKRKGEWERDTKMVKLPERET